MQTASLNNVFAVGWILNSRRDLDVTAVRLSLSSDSQERGFEKKKRPENATSIVKREVEEKDKNRQ